MSIAKFEISIATLVFTIVIALTSSFVPSFSVETNQVGKQLFCKFLN